MALDSGNARRQRDLALANADVGYAQEREGDLAAALESYRRTLSIFDGLARSDPKNSDLQGSLAAAHNDVGHVLKRQSKFEDALKSYREALAILENHDAGASADPQWQRQLAAEYGLIGDVVDEQRHPQEALVSYREGLAIIDRLVKADPGNTELQKRFAICVQQIGSVAYYGLMARDFTTALEAADQAIALAPDQLWLSTNRAHALMFLNHIDEARALYLKYRGRTLQDGKRWEAVILEDFADLRKAGLTNPLMDEIQKLFASAG